MFTRYVIFNALVLLLMLSTLFLCGMALWKRTVRPWWLIVPPAHWALHVAAFCAAALWSDWPAVALVRWLGALLLHSAILVTGGVWIFLWPARRGTR